MYHRSTYFKNMNLKLFNKTKGFEWYTKNNESQRSIKYFKTFLLLQLSDSMKLIIYNC